MAGNLHVRNLDDDLIARLKRRAARAESEMRAPDVQLGERREVDAHGSAPGRVEGVHERDARRAEVERERPAAAGAHHANMMDGRGLRHEMPGETGGELAVLDFAARKSFRPPRLA